MAVDLIVGGGDGDGGVPSEVGGQDGGEEEQDESERAHLILC